MRTRWLGCFVGVLVGAASSARSDDGPVQPAPTATALLERLKGRGALRADDAIEALVRWKDHEFVPAALAQLKDVSDFHARIALGYVLAAHGEKAGLEVLIASLERTGHLGYVYLTRVAPDDFGWNRDGSSLVAWRKWLDGLTEETYRAQVRRRRASPADRNAGRAEFKAAVDAHTSGAARTDVATQLRAYAAAYPEADLVAEARELADQLDEEAKEDATWTEPAAPAALSLEARTAWCVYHLRDATGTRLPLDGYVSLLPRRGMGAPPATGPVAELLAAGRASIPTLLTMLDDRRPVRAAARSSRRVSSREWVSALIVLRYQDVALELLNELLPPPTYQRKYTADYLSAQEPADRAELIADVRRWADETSKASPSELRWIGVRRSGTYDALQQIRQIAFEERQTAEALAELRRMFDGERPAIFRPMICELMTDLGDTSKVAEVLEAFAAGAYSMRRVMAEGDDAVGLNAESTAERIRERYGEAAAAAPGAK